MAIDYEFWTPERIEGFIKSNGFNPTTQEGLIKRVDIALGKIEELERLQRAYGGPFLVKKWKEVESNIGYWRDELRVAYLELGMFVYNKAKQRQP